MRNPRADMYACVIDFVGQIRREHPIEVNLPPQYSKYADVASEDNSKELAGYSLNNLPINLVDSAIPLY